MDRIAFSPTEAAKLLGVSRPTLYQLLHKEGFPSFKIGSRTLIPADSLREWVSNQVNAAEQVQFTNHL